MQSLPLGLLKTGFKNLLCTAVFEIRACAVPKIGMRMCKSETVGLKYIFINYLAVLHFCVSSNITPVKMCSSIAPLWRFMKIIWCSYGERRTCRPMYSKILPFSTLQSSQTLTWMTELKCCNTYIAASMSCNKYKRISNKYRKLFIVKGRDSWSIVIQYEYPLDANQLGLAYPKNLHKLNLNPKNNLGRGTLTQNNWVIEFFG